MHTKYIVFDTPLYGEFPIMFPSVFVHKEIAESLKQINLKPVSAGFCSLEGNGGFVCFGNSDSLDLKSREEDSDLLTVCFT